MSVRPEHILRYAIAEAESASQFRENVERVDGDEGADYDAFDEMMRRAAVRCAYYACFHRGLIYAKRRGYREGQDDGGTHALLWRFLNGFVEVIPATAEATALRDMRVAADYRIGVDCPDADDAVERAQEFFAMIDELEDELARNQARTTP